MQHIYRSPIPRLIIILLVLLAAACTRQTAPQPAAKSGLGDPGSAGTVVTGAAMEKKTGLEPQAATQPASEGSAAQLLPVETLPAVQWSAPPGCSEASCPQLVIAQEGKISRASLSAQGLRAAPAAAAGMPEGSPFVIDTGTPSPDGKWAAYTTLSYESGGPVMLQNAGTGKMVNLIEAVNKRLPDGQAPLSEDLLWDVIGWFPDSTRLMIGPSDLSMVMIVNRKTFATKTIHFDGGGRGGRMFVSLDPDGSRFFFVGDDMQGSQVLSAYRLKDGTVTVIQKTPYTEGVVMQPRFSPNGESVAFVEQKGQPDTGMTYELNLLPAEKGATARALTQGNLAMAVPTWSPDGQYIAFTRDDSHPSLLSSAEGSPETVRGNLWVISVADGKETQVTNLEGLARSPAWAADGKTLAFVTHDGQVGMASIEQPGQAWQAAGPTGAYPELTSVFFLP